MESINEIIKRIIDSGLILTKDGFDYIKTINTKKLSELLEKIILEAQKENICYINEGFLRKFFEIEKEVEEEEKQAKVVKRIKPKIIYSLHPKPLVEVDGFLKYFKSRYYKISELFKRRGDINGVVKTGEVSRLPLKTRFKIIGMINDIVVRGKRLYLDLDDDEGTITIMTADDEVFRKGLMLLKDQVVCVDAIKLRDDLIIAKDFIWPDIASKMNNRAERRVFAVFISDLHVGSVHFLEDLFNDFIRWLNGKFGGDTHREIASRVRYLIIAGDIIDGIGVYPNQIDELEIRDIYEQYEMAAKLLSKIPRQIEIVIIPGNHDAVAKALPQPPIPEEYARELHADERIHLLSNPSYISLEGVEVLICHGRALDDVLSSKPGLDFQHPAKGMELLLRCRHLAPIYGANTPIAPEKEDHLVIDRVPDILHMGHVHVHEVRKYRGVTLIASGSWQSQTAYQRRLDLKPTPGITTIVDLKSLQTYTIDFKALSG